MYEHADATHTPFSPPSPPSLTGQYAALLPRHSPRLAAFSSFTTTRSETSHHQTWPPPITPPTPSSCSPKPSGRLWSF
ncbi:hypothetical protein LIA77_02918 [Sarocladium implicatum]|nr:hypothetical protein LIA77_02918 [Sarocladium implicatum]